MANSSEEEKKETRPIKKNLLPKPNETVPSKNTNWAHYYPWLIGLALATALLSVGIALYTVQNSQASQQKWIDENKSLSSQLSQLEQKQGKAQEQIDAKEENIQQAQQELQNKMDNVTTQLDKAMTQRLYQNEGWLLLKARYYMELAQINTHWSDNYSATIALLEQSDKLLTQLNDPKVFTVRQAIAQEIAQLKVAPSLDIAGLLSQLDAAQTSVDSLTLQTPHSGNNDQSVEQTTTSPNNTTWRTRFNESVSLLEKMVVIRRNDDDIKPLISPLMESVLKDSIRLNLQEAQWAILNNNPLVYELTLKQAIRTLNRGFNEDSPNTTVLLKKLNELQAINLKMEKPKIGTALPLLNQLIENKKSFINAPVPSNKGENKS
ncbi:MAG TPA: uroporphyrinogen-III C-methyltransferase [Legionella sp.]|nr:uroporphyrinogen-III C-methyltransferase [Legionella sp.]